MKRILTLLLFFAFTLATNAQPFNFTVTNVSGTNIITCSSPSINLIASCNYSAAVSYTWCTGSVTLTGSSVGITVSGSYTVTALSGTLSSIQVMSIYSNTLSPLGSISPLTQSISCGGNPVVTASTSTSGNISHLFLTPFGGTFSANSASASYLPGGPGTYTYLVLNNLNGCASTPTLFTVTGGQSFPTFSVSSPQNFTLGCGTKSIATINIVNAATSPTPGGPMSYSVLGPPSNIIPSPYNVAIPGNYTVIVIDNTSLCTTTVAITVSSNYTVPYYTVLVPQQVLDCNVPSVQLQGLSAAANLNYKWLFPGIPGVVIGNTITVNANFPTPTATSIANYTLEVTENSSTCKNYTVVPMYQNIFPPVAKISYGGFDPCITNSVVLTNISVSGIPMNGPFPVTLPVVATWYGPAPQPSLALSSTYLALAPGVYTMTATDQNNGCKTNTMTLNCTGLSTYENIKNEVTVFPNPGTGIYFISSENRSNDQKIFVYNMLGEVIRQQKINSETEKIDLHDVPAGIYLFVIKKGDENISARKIIKQ